MILPEQPMRDKLKPNCCRHQSEQITFNFLGHLTSALREILSYKHCTCRNASCLLLLSQHKDAPGGSFPASGSRIAYLLLMCVRHVRLRAKWRRLMEQPPPVTSDTRPDIVDQKTGGYPDSKIFAKKTKEMRAFGAAVRGYESDPELNPLIVMLAHQLTRYGVPPPETEDAEVHVFPLFLAQAVRAQRLHHLLYARGTFARHSEICVTTGVSFRLSMETIRVLS